MTEAVEKSAPAPANDTSAKPVVSLSRVMLTVFLPFAGGYFLSYLYRSVNAVIAPDLVRDIGLGAGDLGLLTAAYFLAFAAFQIPLGVLMDRFGPRRVQASVLVAAAIGATIFALGRNMNELLLGRALIGLGVCGGLMTALKAITLWFPQPRWPLVNGMYLGCGGLGALAATAPVEAALRFTDWRGIFFALSAITLAASATIFLVVPEKPRAGALPRIGEQIKGIGLIYRDRLFWRLAPISTMCMASNMAIQGLWAGPWLRDVAGLERAAVAEHLFVLTACLTLGFVLTGLLADFLARFGVTLAQVLVGGVIAYLAILLGLTLQIAPSDYWLWAAFGLVGNLTVLVFPILSRHFPLTHSGRASTALNLLVFVTAFALQYAIGAVIDLWPPTASGGYRPEAYAIAFGAVLLLSVFSLAWYLVGNVTAKTVS